MTTPRPADYADGYGELVRAYRYYVGLTPKAMAARLDMSPLSLNDIETGRRKCAPGFITGLAKFADIFDDAVEKVVTWYDKIRPQGGEIKTLVSLKNEWERQTIGRAAVQTGEIIPKLRSDAGYGELLRAHRYYIGLSPKAWSKRMNMLEFDLRNAELEHNDCPLRLVDAAAEVVDEFDGDVKATINNVETETAEIVLVNVDPRDEWQRVVIGRAAVESAMILPGLQPRARTAV